MCVRVSLVEDYQGGYGLSIEIHALLPHMDHDQARQIMEQAHLTCPYSKALRGLAPVVLVVDGIPPDRVTPHIQTKTILTPFAP